MACVRPWLSGLLMATCVSALPSHGADTVHELMPQVVTAMHFPLPAASYPGSASVLSPDLPEYAGLADVRELLTRAPHVRFRNSGGSPADAQIGLRGFGEGGGDRVLVLVDGAPLNRPDMGGVNWLQVPLGAVERVEVLRGGQGVIYGSRAVAGVVKITTREARREGVLDMMTGSHGLRRAGVRAAREGSTVRVTGGAAYHAEDGYRENSAFDAGSAGASAAGGGGRTAWRLTADVASLAAERPGPLVSAGFPANPRASILHGQDFREDSVQATGFVSHSGERTDAEAEAVLRRRVREWNLSGVYADNVNRTARLAPRIRMQAGRADIVAGIDAEREELDALLFARRERAAPFGDAALRREMLAGYLHSTYAASEALALFSGVRAETVDLAFRYAEGNRFSTNPVPLLLADGRRSDRGWAWTGGAVWQFADQARLWLRADRLLRHPLMDEIAAYQGFELSRPFNEDLSPERGWQGELGASWERNRFRMSLALFQTDLRGEILFDPARSLNTNFPRTRRRGVEWDGAFFHGEWTFGAQYTGMDARYRAAPYADRRVYLVPPHSFGGYVSYGRTGPANVRVDARYVSSQFEGSDFSNTRTKLPSHAVFDAALSIRMREGMRVTLAVLNALDRHYATVKYLGGWYPEPGRTARVGLRIDF